MDGRWWLWCSGYVIAVKNLSLCQRCAGSDSAASSASASVSSDYGDGNPQRDEVRGGWVFAPLVYPLKLDVGQRRVIVASSADMVDIVFRSPEEAFLVFRTWNVTVLATINLPQVYQNRQVEFTSYICVPLLYHSAVVVNKRTGKECLLFLGRNNRDTNGTRDTAMMDVYKVDITTGTPKKHITTGISCSRITESLFCVLTQREEAQVWDCNDLSAPLRTASNCPGSGVIMGCCGMMFSVDPASLVVTVTEARTGILIMTIRPFDGGVTERSPKSDSGVFFAAHVAPASDL
ncbi:hypothetical protein Pelo_18876 [Pelomyxa schiedti]|nr:hypothetical protein Pelo_18876 [Pelomyxa schiedti]